MNKQQIKAAIKLLNRSVSIRGWEFYKSLKDAYAKKEFHYTSKWHDSSKSKYHAPPVFGTEGAYSDGVTAEITKEGTVELEIWDCDSMYGEPRTVRSSYTLTDVPAKVLEPYVVSALKAKACRDQECEERARIKAHQEAIYQDMLTTIKGGK